jgi:hypothetical protein
MRQQERDEQPADTSVAIDERVDDFKLSVDQPDPHEWRVWAITVFSRSNPYSNACI